MAIRAEKRIAWTFDEIALNLVKSSRHLKPDEAGIMQDIDLDDDRGALVGRFGTKTINVDGATPDPLAQYQFYDLFRATNTTTNKKYVIGVYDDLANFKIGALCTTDNEKAFTTLQAAGGGDFTLTRPNRVSFCNVREPNLNQVVVMGTNGVDSPFYFKGNGAVTDFNFGDASKFKLKYLLDRPWRGHAWAALRSGEETTVHWSTTTNFLSWVETEGSGFRQCPQDDLLNVFRGFRIWNDKLIVFNLDSIGEIYHTGSTAAPFRFREIKRGHGALHDGAIAVDGDNVWFLDKREPYLKFWNGYNVVDNYAGADTIAKGFQKWMDLDPDELIKTRFAIRGKTLLASFKVADTYAAIGTDNQRWIAAIYLDKLDRNNIPYYPMSLWKIRSNDLLVPTDGTDVGQTYFADAAAQDISGTDYYFLRRIADWFDFRTSEITSLGDRNGITGINAINVDNILQTGWLSLPGEQWFEALFLSVDGEWDGTPSTGTVLNIKYRFEGWTDFATMVVSSVDGITRYPFAHNAQGKRLQLRFEYSDKQSRPVLHRIHVWFKPKPGIRN